MAGGSDTARGTADSNSRQPPRGAAPCTSAVTSSPRAARGPCRRHGAAREPPPEGPRRPRRHPLRAGGLHQPAVLPHRGGQQQAGPRREVPGAAGLPRPAAQRARREGGGAQPGAAALLAGLRCAAVPARREAAGAGGVPAAPSNDGDRRREAAPAATARAAARGCPGGRLGRARHRHQHRHRALTRPGREGPERPGSAPARDCSGPPRPEDFCPVRASDPIKMLPLHSAPSMCCFLQTSLNPRSLLPHLVHRRGFAALVQLWEHSRSSPGRPLAPGALPAVVAHPLPAAFVLTLAVVYCHRAVHRQIQMEMQLVFCLLSPERFWACLFI